MSDQDKEPSEHAHNLYKLVKEYCENKPLGFLLIVDNIETGKTEFSMSNICAPCMACDLIESLRQNGMDECGSVSLKFVKVLSEKKENKVH